MRTSICRRLRNGIAILGLALAPAAAHAGGEVQALVGEYEAKLSCKGWAAGAPVKSKRALTMRVIDILGERRQLDFVDGTGTRQLTTLPFLVFVEPQAKPLRAVASGSSCDVSIGDGTGAAFVSTIKLKVGKIDADFSGTITILRGGDGHEVCSVKAKRLSSETTLTNGCAG
jgi:hypothetical protein